MTDDTTAKLVLEKLERIEELLLSGNDEEADEADERWLRESEIRRYMRIGHAKRMLKLGLDMEIISKVTDLRVEFIEQLREDIESHTN